MEHQEYTWETSDGIRLFAQSWNPENEFEQIILLVHGQGEHSTRYDHWAERFVKNNMAVLTFDLRGHGKSTGKRGHTPNYERFMMDIDILFEKSEELFPGKTKILYGHSLGGNLVLNYTLRREPKQMATIATSPFFRLAFTPSSFQLGLAKVVKNIFPGMIQSTKLQAKFLSRDPQEVNKYVTDPLVHDKISVIQFLSVVESGEWAISNADKITIPALLLHGSGDEITSHHATELFAEKAGEKADCKIWEGCYHELHHEFEREQVFQGILEWINKLK